MTAAWALGLLRLGPKLSGGLWRGLCDAALAQAEDFRAATAPLLLLGAAMLELQPSGGPAAAAA